MVKMMSIFMTIMMIVLESIGSIGSTQESQSYEEKAQDYYEELSAQINEEYGTEWIEALEKEGARVDSVDVYYYRTKAESDNIYSFGAEFVIDGHRIKEIMIVDMNAYNTIDIEDYIDGHEPSEEEFDAVQKLLHVQ